MFWKKHLKVNIYTKQDVFVKHYVQATKKKVQKINYF